jgi:hypothetical protein
MMGCVGQQRKNVILPLQSRVRNWPQDATMVQSEQSRMNTEVYKFIHYSVAEKLIFVV